MNEVQAFSEALCHQGRSSRIPAECDLFGALVGAWDIVWIDHLEDATPRRVQGEWIFSWVLEGRAIQDAFIVPSRAERQRSPQPDAEYGTTIRIYNPKTGHWDIFYGCPGEAIRLTARREGSDVVLLENETQAMRYVFSGITPYAFSWRKERLNDAGAWFAVAHVEATRRPLK